MPPAAPVKPVLMGCRDYGRSLPMPTGTVLVKSGRLYGAEAIRERVPAGTPQHAYRHTETGTWYQVTQIPGGWRLCEYVGSDCPCARGK